MKFDEPEPEPHNKKNHKHNKHNKHSNNKDQKNISFFDRISTLLLRDPENLDEFNQILSHISSKRIISPDVLSIIEGAISTSQTRVEDIMTPKVQMDMINISANIDEILPIVINTAHSRFPVIEGEDKNNVLGILLSKDLLRIYTGEQFKIRDWIRPAVFIPESKRLNVLLREFRDSKNHMAIVVDEYSNVSGLVTMEDVLEQIVGDIEDEYDIDDDEDNIRCDTVGQFRIKARTTIEDFNEKFNTNFNAENCDTVGGLVLRQIGRVPKTGEIVNFPENNMSFKVLRADNRRLYTLLLSKNNE